MAIPSWTMVHRMADGRGGWNRGKSVRNLTQADHDATTKRYRDRRIRDVQEWIALGIVEADSEIARRYVNG